MYNILTTKELAEYLKLNEKTIIKMAQQREIPGVKIGNQWRFNLSAIDAHMQQKFMRASDKELDSMLNPEPSLICLSRLVSRELIKLDSQAKNKEEVLEELAAFAKERNLCPDQKRLLNELKKREMMLSTGVNNGVAIPHPRNPSGEIFKKPNVLMLRTLVPIDYDAQDNNPVNLFFMICVPSESIHLRVLANIAKLLHRQDLLDKIMKAEKASDILKILMEFDRDLFFKLAI